MEHLMPVFLFLAAGIVALFFFISIAVFSTNRLRERTEFYKSETLRRFAETGAGATAAIEVLREDERMAQRKLLEKCKLGGLVTAATGLGLIAFLHMLIPDAPVFLSGVIPVFIGIALLAYAYLFAAKA